MVFRHAHFVPIILCIWFPLTFVITYCVAVYNRNVIPVFPYISDTGSWSPESCIFDLLLTTGSIFMAIVLYVRYRQVRELCEKNDFKPVTSKLNKIALYLGIIATYGVIVVGCFQETNVLSIHLMGASMCFGIGTLYQILQVVISFLIYPTLGKRYINITRAICTSVTIVAFGVTSLFGLLSMLQFTGNDITKWKKEDGGHTFHLISVYAEWVLAIDMFIFLGLFHSEFKQIDVLEPEVMQKVV